MAASVPAADIELVRGFNRLVTRQVDSRNFRTSPWPRMVEGQAESSYTMSSVISSSRGSG